MSTDIRSTIVIEGQDQFSAVFGKLDKAAKNAGDSMNSAASRSAVLAERAGDAERGFIGLKDILGSVAGGPLQEVADRMGGIEAVIKGFGPTMGAAGLAIAAAGAAVGYVWNQLAEQQKRVGEEMAKNYAKLAADKDLLAERYGVSRDILGAAEKEVGQTKLKADAQKIVNELKELEERRFKAIGEGNKDAAAWTEKKIGYAKEELQSLDRNLQLTKESQAFADKRKAQEEWRAANDDVLLQTERAIELTADRRLQMDLRRGLIVDKMRAVEQEILVLRNREATAAKATTEGVRLLLSLEEKLFGLKKEQQANESAIAADEKARESERRAAASAAAARSKARREEERKAVDAYYQAQTELEASLTAQQTERANRLIALEDKIRQAKEASAIAGAGNAIERVDLQARFAAERLEAERQKALQVQADRAEEGAAMLREIEARGVLEAQKFAADRVRAEQEVQQAKDATAQKARDTAAAERAARLESIDMATATASAVVAGLEQVGIAEQAAAGLKAGIAFAEAGLAAARGNWAGAVAGVASGIQFGKVALSGGSAPPPGIGGGGMGTGGAQQQGSTGGGMGGAVVINFNKGFYGDAASTAKGIAGTLKTIGSSGIPAWKGA